VRGATLVDTSRGVVRQHSRITQIRIRTILRHFATMPFEDFDASSVISSPLLFWLQHVLRRRELDLIAE